MYRSILVSRRQRLTANSQLNGTVNRESGQRGRQTLRANDLPSAKQRAKEAGRARRWSPGSGASAQALRDAIDRGGRTALRTPVGLTIYVLYEEEISFFEVSFMC